MINNFKKITLASVVSAAIIFTQCGPGGNKGGGSAHALHDFEPEHPAIKTEGALEIGDLEMDVADPDTRGDGG